MTKRALRMLRAAWWLGGWALALAACSSARVVVQAGALDTAVAIDESVAFDFGDGSGLPRSCGPRERACYFGAAFADCGESSDPAQPPLIYCSQTDVEKCVWVSDGCPAGDYVLPFGDGSSCWCVAPGCTYAEGGLPWLFSLYGNEPWTRERGLNVEVKVSDGTPPSAQHELQLSCANLVGYDWTQNNPCEMGARLSVRRYDTTVFRIAPLDAGLSGWLAEVEVDSGKSPMLARICRLGYTDYITCRSDQPILCATAGQVELIRQQGVLYLSAFRAEFADGAALSGQMVEP
jgi:hypothetical protein